MKIPIKVENFAGGLRPMVSCCLKSDEPHIFGFINAIIDTGSPSTILGWADIEKMRLSQIQMNKLIGQEREVNLGGAQMRTRMLPNPTITIGNHIKINIPIQVPIKLIKGISAPTILGVDFLVTAKLKFVFDPANKEAYFEMPD